MIQITIHLIPAIFAFRISVVYTYLWGYFFPFEVFKLFLGIQNQVRVAFLKNLGCGQLVVNKVSRKVTYRSLHHRFHRLFDHFTLPLCHSFPCNFHFFRVFFPLRIYKLYYSVGLGRYAIRFGQTWPLKPSYFLNFTCVILSIFLMFFELLHWLIQIQDIILVILADFNQFWLDDLLHIFLVE